LRPQHQRPHPRRGAPGSHQVARRRVDEPGLDSDPAREDPCPRQPQRSQRRREDRPRVGLPVRPGTPAVSYVLTALQGTNADLIERVAQIYLKPGMAVADVTYGKGVFWQKVDTGQFDFLP